MKTQNGNPSASMLSGSYYWVWGTSDNGKRAISGPKMTENEAYVLGFQMFPSGNFETKLLPTRDKAKAVSMLKAGLIERGHGLDDSLRRFKHPRKKV
jgi:alpha-galactosidase